MGIEAGGYMYIAEGNSGTRKVEVKDLFRTDDREIDKIYYTYKGEKEVYIRTLGRNKPEYARYLRTGHKVEVKLGGATVPARIVAWTEQQPHVFILKTEDDDIFRANQANVVYKFAMEADVGECCEAPRDEQDGEEERQNFIDTIKDSRLSFEMTGLVTNRAISHSLNGETVLDIWNDGEYCLQDALGNFKGKNVRMTLEVKQNGNR